MRSIGNRKTDGSSRSRRRTGASVIAWAVTPLMLAGPAGPRAPARLSLPDPAVALVPFLDQAIDLNRLQDVEMPAQCGAGGVGGHAKVRLRAARRLRHDLVRQPQTLEIAGGELQRIRRFHLLGDVTPEDRGAGF